MAGEVTGGECNRKWIPMGKLIRDVGEVRWDSHLTYLGVPETWNMMTSHKGDRGS